MPSYLAIPLVMQLRPACAGTYLRWLSPIDTWEGWLFEGDVDTKTDLAEATDISSADARVSVAVRRPGADTLVVRTGDLSDAQHAALATILDSPQVYRQLPDSTRQPVLVSANTSITRTSAEGKHELELELKLPARNAITH
jgi:hypothetical protein